MSTDISQSETDPSDHYALFHLALWAGDILTADRLLSEILGSTRLSSKSLEFAEDPIIAAAEHRRRQLQYRDTEYNSLCQAAGLPTAFSKPPKRLESKQGHLAGIVHCIDERTFEFRCYLTDLDWESSFYSQLASMSKSRTAFLELEHLEYGLKLEAKDLAQDTAETQVELETGLGIRFYQSDENVLSNIQASDFCTFQAQSIWFSQQPESADEILFHFEALLNEIDE
ncbi:hypothetical protein [Rubinisphaera sp. JC750]|uniref:hypothetical protein n=1 Tax=Rubinisphaera sp. JC750 TaxID=2898658 RepID=UPI001F357D79|nr:hypothetical protein [Rubinisphaera sp. JC750]